MPNFVQSPFIIIFKVIQGCRGASPKTSRQPAMALFYVTSYPYLFTKYLYYQRSQGLRVGRLFHRKFRKRSSRLFQLVNPIGEGVSQGVREAMIAPFWLRAV